MVQFAEEHKLLHGYLEDQLFEPAVTRGREIIWRRGVTLTGRPFLARAAEEHSGPHVPWFWQGKMQDGGVLNDMMCHSVEVARFLLTEPGYEAENRYFSRCFLHGERPEINFYDGLAVTELLMVAYKSNEEERTIDLVPGAFDDFIPAVARGTWNPRA